MPRNKEYIELEVIDKAKEVFWENGYHGTSVRMLKQAMGINQFSIYSCFKSKEGILSASITKYRKDVLNIQIEIALSKNLGGLETIKFFVKSYIKVTKGKGCFIDNLVEDLYDINSEIINGKVKKFTNELKLFLRTEIIRGYMCSEQNVDRLVLHIMILFQGLLKGSKTFSSEIINDQINLFFDNLKID